MYDTLGRGLPKGHAQNWGAGFLPSVYQGTALKPQGDPIDNLDRARRHDRRPAAGAARPARPSSTGGTWSSSPARPSWRPGSRRFELAYRMQMAAPEALDVDQRDRSRRRSCTASTTRSATHFARQCLIARRLVERGVRFVQIYSGGMENELSWDGHTDIAKNHGGFAAETDQPIAGLLADLKARGLLDSTLVIWGGEFGRLPIVQKGGTGRDHNPHAFTDWLAGGGVKGGVALRRRPTRSATRRSRTASASTTCTRRSCTCWASTTRS